MSDHFVANGDITESFSCSAESAARYERKSGFFLWSFAPRRGQLLSQSSTSSYTICEIKTWFLQRAKPHAHQHAAYGATQASLLGHGHDPHALFTPDGQQIKAFVLASRQAVEFPDHHRLHGSIKDGLLQALTRGALSRPPSFLILEPLHACAWDALAAERRRATSAATLPGAMFHTGS
jgi:hypothetical protein